MPTCFDFPEMYGLAGRPNWPDYFGAPRLATAAEEEREFRSLSAALQAMARKILDGQKWQEIPRFADNVDPQDAQGQAEAERRGAAMRKKQNAWLEAHRLGPKE